MRKRICFLLLVILMAILYAACADKADPPPPAGEVTDPAPTTAAPTEQTRKPTLIDKTFLAPDRYCVAGSGEEGAAIKIEGGLKPVTGKVIDGQFIIELFVENQTSKDVTLSVYAVAEGKLESEPLAVTVGKNEPRDHKPMCVGKENHIHYNETIDDFLGRGLFDDNQLDRMRLGAENLQRQLDDAGLSTKLVIFVSPNHGTIYPETMPDFLAEQKESDNSRLKQLTELFRGSVVKFINPYDRLMKEKENYFIYNRTDTHWNELGAYFGYCELFDYIGETFPAAKPRPMEDFNIYQANVNGGDIIPMFPFDQNLIIENTYVVRIKESSVRELHRDDTNEIAYQEGRYHAFQEYNRSAAAEQPTILMYRDSFSISMMSPIAETSKRVIFHNMWDYNIDMDYVKSVNPDFIVVQRVERILYDLPSVFRKFR